jgi:hypothetical protein
MCQQRNNEKKQTDVYYWGALYYREYIEYTDKESHGCREKK